jgi:hypothetical protein
MLAISSVKVRERQFHYIDQVIGTHLISVDGTMLKTEKLCIDLLRKHGKSKTDVMEGI